MCCAIMAYLVLVLWLLLLGVMRPVVLLVMELTSVLLFLHQMLGLARFSHALHWLPIIGAILPLLTHRSGGNFAQVLANWQIETVNLSFKVCMHSTRNKCTVIHHHLL